MPSESAQKGYKEEARASVVRSNRIRPILLSYVAIYLFYYLVNWALLDVFQLTLSFELVIPAAGMTLLFFLLVS